MQCKKCGAMIEPGSMFCGVCGSKVETNNYGYSAPTNSYVQPTSPNSNPYNNGVNTPPVTTPTPNTPKPSNNNLTIIVTILVILVVVVLILLVKTNSDDKPNDGESNNTTTVENYLENNSNNIPDVDDYINNSESTTYFEIQGVTSPTDTPTMQNQSSSVQRVVTADGGLRIRKQPSVDYGEKIGLVPKGTIVTVERFENDWAYITYEGVSGWCSSEFLFDPANFGSTPIYSAIVTSYSGIKMYSNPNGTSNSVVGSIPYKANVNVYKVEGNWSYVSYNNTFGWCTSASLY